MANKCLTCKKSTDNPKFCSSSCAAKLNNKLSPKRSAKWQCEYCGEKCLPRRKFCNGCNQESRDITLKQAIYNLHHKSSAYALVRTRARAVMKGDPRVCNTCSYSVHVEVCHIRPIKAFPLTARLSEINKKDNLMLLCPNCHWEYDHKIGV